MQDCCPEKYASKINGLKSAKERFRLVNYLWSAVSAVLAALSVQGVTTIIDTYVTEATMKRILAALKLDENTGDGAEVGDEVAMLFAKVLQKKGKDIFRFMARKAVKPAVEQPLKIAANHACHAV